MKRRVAFLFAVALAGCGGTSNPQDVIGESVGADVVSDARSDVTSGDGASDVSTDVALDAATDATADIAMDDVANDSAPDVVDDVQPDGITVDVMLDGSTAGALCTASGGTVDTARCCGATGDFPNSCLTGACSCAPSSSHNVMVCVCPSGQCFDPVLGCRSGP